MTRVSIFLLCSYLLGTTSYGAAPAPTGSAEKEELVFKTEAGKKAFEDAKAAFMAKNYSEAKSLLSKANRDARDSATKAELRRWAAGLKGLQTLLLLERKMDSAGAGFVYENAQRKYLVNIANPSATLYRQLLDKLEKPERKLVHELEGFERHGPYDTKFGKSFVYKAKEPQYVIVGERSLKWECKNRDCVALKISGGPKDWSGFGYLGFWLYGTRGKTSDLQMFLTNPRPKRRVARGSFNGFQAKIPGHVGWKFITLDLPGGDKRRRRSSKGGFRRIGTGDLSKIVSLQFQLPSVKRFVVYLDHVVLVRKK
jgi:hypothetical protein